MRILAASEAGRDFIANFEGGYRLQSYICPAGVWTISAGITAYSDNRNDRVKEGDSLPSVGAAKELFARRLKHFEAGVDSLTRDDLKQQEFDALTSFAFNLGVQALATSTLVRRVNNASDQPETIQLEFERWIFANGRRMRGLWRRRHAEALLFNQGLYLGPDDALLDDEK